MWQADCIRLSHASWFWSLAGYSLRQGYTEPVVLVPQRADEAMTLPVGSFP